MKIVLLGRTHLPKVIHNRHPVEVKRAKARQSTEALRARLRQEPDSADRGIPKLMRKADCWPSVGSLTAELRPGLPATPPAGGRAFSPAPRLMVGPPKTSTWCCENGWSSAEIGCLTSPTSRSASWRPCSPGTASSINRPLPPTGRERPLSVPPQPRNPRGTVPRPPRRRPRRPRPSTAPRRWRSSPKVSAGDERAEPASDLRRLVVSRVGLSMWRCHSYERVNCKSTGHRCGSSLTRVSDLVRCTTGGWMVRPPARCPNGHELGPGHVLVGNQPCGGCGRGGHMTWTCRECQVTTYRPAMGSACRVLHGPAPVRISTTTEERRPSSGDVDGDEPQAADDGDSRAD